MLSAYYLCYDSKGCEIVVTSNPYYAIYTNREWPADADGVTRISYTFSSANGNGDDAGGMPTYAFSTSQQAAMREAFLTLERVAKIDFIETAATQPGFADLALRQFDYDDSTTLGHVSRLPGINTDVLIDVGMRLGFDPNNANNGHFTTLIHEAGHALGLAHTHEATYGSDVLLSSLDDERASVMTYNNYRNATGYVFYVQTPQLYDIAVLQDKYGVNTAYNSGNTTYDLSSLAYSKYAGTVWDGGGTDTYDARGIDSNVTLDLREGLNYVTTFNTFGASSSGNYSNITYIWTAFGANIEKANGGSGHDMIYGNDLANTLIGYGGSDTIIAYNGNDMVNGHSGNDNVNGHSGNDVLRGGAGNDTVRGGADNDTLRGDLGNDVVRGDRGNDAVYGDNGNDYVNGHEGADTARGGADSDTVRGGPDNDYVYGDAGNDIVYGDKGSDAIDGGAGRDSLLGGTGADRFVFYNLADSTDSARDKIVDFSADDIIDLSRFAFTGIAEGVSNGSVLGFSVSGGYTIVEAADSSFSFELIGNIALSNADFDFA